MNEPGDQLEILEQLIPQLPQARLAEQFGDALHDASINTVALLPDIERMERWQQSVHSLRESWDSDEESETLLALETLQAEGEMIAAAQDREQVSQLRGTAMDAKQRIAIVLRDGLRAWQRRIEADIGSLGNLGALLIEFNDTRALGSRMVSIKSRGDSLKTQFPPPANQLEGYRQLLRDADTVRRNLAAIGAGASIETFLLALASERATLDMVDEAVLHWIRERNSDNRFCLSLLRAGGR
jgi:hypothetical protein